MQADGVRLVSGAMSISRVDGGYRVLAKLAAALGSARARGLCARSLAGESGVDLERSALRRRGDRGANRHAALRGPRPLRERRARRRSRAAAGEALAEPRPRRARGAAVRCRAACRSRASDANAAARLRRRRRRGAIEAAAEGVEGAFGRVGGLALERVGQAQQSRASRMRARPTFTLQGSAEGVALADAGLARCDWPIGRVEWQRIVGRPASRSRSRTCRSRLDGASASFAGTATRRATATAPSLRRWATSRALLRLRCGPLAGQADLKATGTVDHGRRLRSEARRRGDRPRARRRAARSAARRRDEDRGRRCAPRRRLRLRCADARQRAACGEVTRQLRRAGARPDASAPASPISHSSRRVPLGAASVDARSSPARATRRRSRREASGEDVVLMGRPLTGRHGALLRRRRRAADGGRSGALRHARRALPVRGSAKLAAGERRRAHARRPGRLGRRKPRFRRPRARRRRPSRRRRHGRLARSLQGRAALPRRGERHAARRRDAFGRGRRAIGGLLRHRDRHRLRERHAGIGRHLRATARDLFRAPQIDGDFSRPQPDGRRPDSRRRDRHGRAAGPVDSVRSRRAARRRQRQPRRAASRRSGEGSRSRLQSFAYARPGIDLALAAPTTIVVENGTARFEQTTLKAGGGSVALSGQAGAHARPDGDAHARAGGAGEFLCARTSARRARSPALSTREGHGRRAERDLQRSHSPAPRSPRRGMPGSVRSPSPPTARSPSGRSTLTEPHHRRRRPRGRCRRDGRHCAGRAAQAARHRRRAAVARQPPARRARRGARRARCNLDIAVVRHGLGAAILRPRHLRGRRLRRPRNRHRAAQPVACRDLSPTTGSSSSGCNADERRGARSPPPARSGSTRRRLPGRSCRARCAQARYVDGTLVAARFDADLKLTGSFVGAARCSAGPVYARPHRDHRAGAAAARFRRGRREARRSAAAGRGDARDRGARTASARRGRRRQARPASVSTSTINAPQQIFVRGRGLDAELGGDLAAHRPGLGDRRTGAFQMGRGRLDILTQRITFDRGIITFAGDLDPILDFSGSTQSGDITITVTVTGRASDPQVTFSSVAGAAAGRGAGAPDLPARGSASCRRCRSRGSPQRRRSSPAAVGRASSSRLRAIDRPRRPRHRHRRGGRSRRSPPAATSARTSISACSRARPRGSSRVTIDLDVTKDVKARAGMGADGNSSLGIFFEKEY